MADAILAIDPQAPGTAGFEAQGFELGRDHARWGLIPPAQHLGAESPVRQGWQAGRHAVGRRARPAGPGVQAWLALRLQAWARGQAFEPMTVTPHYLAQITASHCPVTRQRLQHDPAAAANVVSLARPSNHPDQAAVVRLCQHAGYAAGHLATMSLRAATAQEDLSLAEVLERVEQLRQQRRDSAPADRRESPHPTAVELTLVQWSRLAVLRSFVTPLTHAQAAALPLLVLPPNRLRLLNPIQGLQTLVTLLLARSGWSRRLPQLEALMPHAAARRELHQFFMILMPRVIAAGRPVDAQARRWALEDAWRHPQVQAAWKRFALLLDAPVTDAILARAVDAGLVPAHARMHTAEQAVEGWTPETPEMPAPAAPQRAPVRPAAESRAPRGARMQPARPAHTAAAMPRQLSLPIDG